MPQARKCRRLVAVSFIAASLLTAIAHTSAQEPYSLDKAAHARFGELSVAEQRILRATPEGEVAWIGANQNEDDPAYDAMKAESWPAARVVRADLLKWLCTDPQAKPSLVSGSLQIVGAQIRGPLDLSYASVQRPLELRHCWLPDGINLHYAKLATLNLTGSRTGRINGRRLIASGDLFIQSGSFGPLDLSRAEVSGDVICAGSHFDTGEVTVSLAQAHIGGNASLNEGFETTGVVDVSGSRIGGDLSFYDAHFIGDSASGVDATSAHIDGALYWIDVKTTLKTYLNLTESSAGAIWDDKQSWPTADNLQLDGFMYGKIVGPMSIDDRMEWLGRQPKVYWPQPFDELAHAFRLSGQDRDAADILIAKEDANLRYGGLSRPDQLWKLLLKITIGYGYKPLRALWWIFSFVLVGAILFSLGFRSGVISPTDEEAHRTLAASGKLPASYQPFHAAIFSLEHFLPLVDLHQKDYWLPNPQSPASHLRFAGLGINAGSVLRWYLWIHTLAGWILTPLFLAGLSGLVRAA